MISHCCTFVSNKKTINFLYIHTLLEPEGTPVVKPDTNQCQNNPCRNGGSCYDLYKRFKCLCTEGFTGTYCEKSGEKLKMQLELILKLMETYW